MTAEAVLVTGVHAEELEFGDRVSRRLEPSGGLETLRIPEGVPQRCDDVEQQFRYETRQRELYLQLHQQVKGRFGLLIDLHSGYDESGTSADVYCRDPALLDCVGCQVRDIRLRHRVRLLRIVAPGERAGVPTGRIEAAARTRIPPVIWEHDKPVYVGLEIYLPDRRDGRRDGEVLAQRLIEILQRCHADH